MTRVVPGPLRRLARQPLRAVAVMLLAGVALAASGIQSAAATALQSTLDANWRGAYDILVTPRDGMHAVNGMLPPNTLNSTLSGMTLDDLKKVRAVADVDVAAPIGTVLVPGLKDSTVTLHVPGDLVGASREPQAFRLTATYTTDDGLGERVVWRESMPFVLDESHPDDAAACPDEQAYGDYTFRSSDYPALAASLCDASSGSRLVSYWDDMQLGYAADGDGYGLALPATALSSTRITLVDPVAEKALLGDSGDFLDPLIALKPTGATRVADIEKWATRVSAGDVVSQIDRYTSGLAGATPEALAELKKLYADNGADWSASMASSWGGAVPLIVSQAPTAALSVKVDIAAFGAAGVNSDPDDFRDYTLPAALTSGDAGTSVGSVSTDVSSVLNPFVSSGGELAWPGQEQSAQTDVDEMPLELRATGRAASTGYTTADGVGVRLDADGYRSPVSLAGDGVAPLTDDGDAMKVGSEASYQRLQQTWAAGDAAAPIAVPVGSFSADAVDTGRGAVGSVPLGAYDAVDATVSDGPHAGATMQPAISGTGLVSTRTAAIASIASSSLWEDDAPIDAIRVRVADVGGYSLAAQKKIIAVAQAIEKLGFEATVVAGSSPTDVAFDVTGYAFGTMDPNGTQTVGDLGTVTQRWSELGAAARVDLSVSTATYAMLGIGLVAVLLLMGTVQLAAIPGRRMQARAMRDIGFTRARIARWYAAEEVPGWLIVALVGGAAIVLAADRLLAALVVGAALVVIAVVGAISVTAGSRSRIATRPRGATSRRVGAASIVGFGARQARIHPLSSVAHTVAIVVVGVACAGLVAVALTARTEAGDSLLAGLTWVRMLWPKLALGIAGVGGGLLLARLVRRIDLDRRAGQWRVLRAAGWTAGQLAAAQRAEGTVVALPAIVLAALAAWGGAVALGVEPTWLSAVIAAGAGLVCALLTFTARGRGRDA
ncbi:hypothetical protein [Microbacterium sp. KR10-403]|uniref:hypothetical protein n=1 Tax=Microbacterium sp. KR10-403 TaxID=3158581 RepID=UPI0032E498C2